jgi:hypothetical protein
MPNGKGSLDCSYCIHFEGSSGYPEGFGEERLCKFHQVVVPKGNVPHNNRICCNFEPNEGYYRDNPLRQYITLARRFAWFGIDMEPGVLYEFCYNQPPGITKIAVLRIPDYQARGWKKPTE